jgi:hypothetical protein
MTLAQQTYLEKVLPWPTGEDDLGFCNIHWTFTPKDHKAGRPYPWSGQACRSVAEALNAIERAQKSSGTRDIYACQSRQLRSGAAFRKGGKLLKPLRNHANSVLLKSLFLDIDLKDYASGMELNQALIGFIASSSLPRPSVIVSTTGGFHVYWTFTTAITPAEWSPLAHSLAEATKRLGLKSDTACTVDAARVLRVPDTTNFKRNASVKLIGAAPVDYDVEDLRKILLPFEVMSGSSSAKSIKSPFVADASLFPPKKVEGIDELSAGIEPPSYPVIHIKDVMGECPFILEALKTGGKDYANPLWNLTTLLSTFVEDGDKVAHLMGRNHPGYTRETTDALYERKLREKAEKGLGWPSCKAISGSGSKLCATCKHFNQGKSPLNFSSNPIRLHPNLGTQRVGVKTVSVLPAGYTRSPKGFIQKAVTADDGSTSYVVISEIPIGDAWLQQDPWSMHFAAEVKPGDTRQVALPFELVDTQEMRKELSRQGVTLHAYQVKLIGEFLLSWIDELKKTKDAVVNTSPFGWNSRDGKLEGFVYGGRLFTPTEIRIAPSPDAVTSKGYTPTGSIDPWVDAAKLITNQHRPALNAIVAASFAAPLVRFTHMDGLMLSCVGATGIGKSTALDVGLTVWGHRVRAKNTVNDTDNSVMGKAGELKSLPVYWDDLRFDDIGKYWRMLFQHTYGSERKRLMQNAKQREFGTWSTIMVSTSNASLMELTAKNAQTDAASLYRLFEIQVEGPNGSPGQIAKTDAARMIGRLGDNFGRVGEAYAEYLGKNFSSLEDEVLNYQKTLDDEVNALQEERFWTSLMACVCMGAKLANKLGFTEIDEDELRAFLITSLGNMRRELNTQVVDLTKETNVSAVLSNFLNAQRARHTLVTNVIHKGRGKPAKDSILIRNDASRLEDIRVHIGVDDKLLHIESTALSEWCKEKGISRHALTKALEKEYDTKVVHGKIGGGTMYSVAGIVYMLEISLADLEGNINIEELVNEPVFDTALPSLPNKSNGAFSYENINRVEEPRTERNPSIEHPPGSHTH